MGLGWVIEKRVAKMFNNELNNCYVKAIYDLDKKKVEKYKKIMKCDGIKSLKNFLSVESDYVYIATESGNHYKHILECFKKNMICGHNQLRKADLI